MTTPVGGKNNGGTLLELRVRSRSKAREPFRYRVVMLNDDHTPMDFAVEVLEKIFDKSPSEATEVMLRVHLEGSALCGVYSFEIAETKAVQAARMSKHHNHPLRCVLERDC